MAKKIRVLHVLEASLGGTRRILEGIVYASAGLPIENYLVYSSLRADSGFWELLEEIKRRGWHTIRIDIPRRIGWSDIAAGLKLKKALRDIRPDIIHCHSSKAGGVVRTVIGSPELRKAKIVYAPHALAVHLRRYYLHLEKALAFRTNLFLGDSPSECEEIVALGLAPRERVDVLYPAIDISYFSPIDACNARAKIGIDSGPLVVGIGRLTMQKDPLEFLRVMKEVIEQNRDVRAIWVGDGELRADFENEAKHLGLDKHVSITGWVDDVRPFVAAADVVLSTSRYESFGFLVAEPLLMARPVVSSAVTGPIDILSGWGGEDLLFPQGATFEAAERVSWLLGNRLAADKFATLGRNASISRFGIAAVREKMAAIYGRLLGVSVEPLGS